MAASNKGEAITRRHRYQDLCADQNLRWDLGWIPISLVVDFFQPSEPVGRFAWSRPDGTKPGSCQQNTAHSKMFILAGFALLSTLGMTTS